MKTSIALLLLSLFLFSCADNKDTPSQVAEKYWHAIQYGDTQIAKRFITNNSKSHYSDHIKSLQGIYIDNFIIDDSKTTLITIINPDAKTPGDEIIFDTRLVLENNQWKIDLNNTHIPPSTNKKNGLHVLTDDLSTTMQKNIQSIEKILKESMYALNKTLKEGSDEMIQSMLEVMKELNEKIRERRKKKQAEPNSSIDESGEGLI